MSNKSSRPPLSRRAFLGALAGAIHSYPTVGSVWARLADLRRRDALKPWLRSLLDGWFAWNR